MAPGATVLEISGNLAISLEQTDVKADAASKPELVVIGFDDQWLYCPDTGHFDISRGSTTKLIIECDDTAYNHEGVIIDPRRTCMVVVDMQNYFINPDFYHHSEGLATVDPILLTIDRCRHLGIQIVWLNWITNEVELRSVPPSVLRAFNKSRVQERGHGWGMNLGSVLHNGERVLFEGTFKLRSLRTAQNSLQSCNRCVLPKIAHVGDVDRTGGPAPLSLRKRHEHDTLRRHQHGSMRAIDV